MVTGDFNIKADDPALDGLYDLGLRSVSRMTIRSDLAERQKCMRSDLERFFLTRCLGLLDYLPPPTFRHSLNPTQEPFFEYPVTRPSSTSKVDHIFYSPATLGLAVVADREHGVVDASRGLSDHLAVRQAFDLDLAAMLP